MGKEEKGEDRVGYFQRKKGTGDPSVKYKKGEEKTTPSCLKKNPPVDIISHKEGRTMKVLGIITEYNPFHQGHLYHLSESRKETQSQAVICVMSGSFLQRGEPALINKWARTQMALEMGVDLLFEIPAAYATRSAEAFAFGAVRLLVATGLVDCLSFGSELGDITPLQSLAEFLVQEPPAYKKALAQSLAEGYSFPQARNQALVKFFPGEEHLPAMVQNPNNILGLEYMKALYRLKSPIEVFTIKRRGSHYHDKTFQGTFASATAIRQHLQEKKPLEGLKEVLPIPCFEILKKELEKGEGPIFLEDLTPYLFFLLRRTSLPDQRELLGVGEGLENRFQKALLQSTTLEELLSTVKTRRYPWTRLQRILIHQFLQYRSQEAAAFDRGGGPRYLRILGFTQQGQELLKKMKKSAWLPTISRVAPFYQQSFGPTQKMLELEFLATDLYGLLYKKPARGLPGEDFRRGPIICK